MLRARWTALYRDTPMLHTAFAFESVLDEVIYMMGSVFAISLSVALFPEAVPTTILPSRTHLTPAWMSPTSPTFGRT